MSTFILFFLLLLFGLLPVTFHLHYHRRGKDDYFVLELRLWQIYIWRYEIPSIDWGGVTLLNQESWSSVGDLDTEQKSAQENLIGPDAFLANLIQISQTLKKYGLGGTFFYFFLPKKYRSWVTVEEKMEKKGRFKRFVWRTVLSGVEPAVLGPVTGLFWSAKGVIVGFLTNEYVFKTSPRIIVVPSFTEKSWETMLDCIFEIKLGHIIVAGIKEYLIQLGGGKKHAGTPD